MRMLRWLGYIWALPLTLVGLALAPFYRTSWWAWRDGVLEVSAERIMGRFSGQTFGWLVFYDPELRGSGVLRAHEHCHVRQAMVGGVFFALAYGAHFLYLWAKTGFRDWWWAYWCVWFERQARRAAGRWLLANRGNY